MLYIKATTAKIGNAANGKILTGSVGKEKLGTKILSRQIPLLTIMHSLASVNLAAAATKTSLTLKEGISLHQKIEFAIKT